MARFTQPGGEGSNANIADFVFTDSGDASTISLPGDKEMTITAGESEDLYLVAGDDLYLDALGDDIHLRAEDDLRIKTGYDFNEDSAQSEWVFANTGILTLPPSGQIRDSNGINQLANRVEGSWTLAPGANTVSFTVDWNYTYAMWVRGNIPNGIAVWNAFVTVTNANVPVIGNHYAWNYVDGNALVFTAIPTQIVGTAGSISTSSPAVGTESNTFVFSITNNSGQSQTLYYGYIKI
jgi:hypothetical protein